MPKDTDHSQRIAQLEQMRLDRFYATRWAVIDAARRDGMTWQAIADALGMLRPAVLRVYRDHRPKDAPEVD